MSVHILQTYVCDLCGCEVRKLDRQVAAGSVPEVILSDYSIRHNGTLLDVCSACWPDLSKAYVMVRKEKRGLPL